MTFKAVLCLTWCQAGISQQSLTRALDVAEREVPHMQNRHHATTATTTEHKSCRLAKQITVTYGKAARTVSERRQYHKYCCSVQRYTSITKSTSRTASS